MKQCLPMLTLGLFLVLLAPSENWAEPGKAFESIREALLAKYDTDGNGRLDASEREAMRAATKQLGEQNQRRGGRRGWSPPAEWIERYDANGDGELDRSEQGMAFAGEQERMRQNYDQNGNGTLDEEEKAKLRQDLEKGKFDGFDRFVAMQVGEFRQMGRRGRGRAGFSQSQRGWLDFDADGDGKASAEELQAIREAKK